MKHLQTMAVAVDAVKVWTPASGLFARYTNGELAELNQAVAYHGSDLSPIVVDPIFRLVDGYNRLIAAQERKAETILAEVWEYRSDDEMLIDAIQRNAKRRHLTAVERARAAAKLAELRKPQAAEVKARRAAGGAKGGRPSAAAGQEPPEHTDNWGYDWTAINLKKLMAYGVSIVRLPPRGDGYTYEAYKYNALRPDGGGWEEARFKTKKACESAFALACRASVDLDKINSTFQDAAPQQRSVVRIVRIRAGVGSTGWWVADSPGWTKAEHAGEGKPLDQVRAEFAADVNVLVDADMAGFDDESEDDVTTGQKPCPGISGQGSAKRQSAAEKAASELGVDTKTVRAVAKVDGSGDAALIGAMERGEVAVGRAAKLADLPAEQRQAVLDQVKASGEGWQKAAAALGAPTADVFVASCAESVMRLREAIHRTKFDELPFAQLKMCSRALMVLMEIGHDCEDKLYELAEAMNEAREGEAESGKC